jgi:hypothetical protein
LGREQIDTTISLTNGLVYVDGITIWWGYGRPTDYSVEVCSGGGETGYDEMRAYSSTSQAGLEYESGVISVSFLSRLGLSRMSELSSIIGQLKVTA